LRKLFDALLHPGKRAGLLEVRSRDERPHGSPKQHVAVLLAVLVIAAIGAAILGIIALLSSGSDNLSVLLQKMAEVIETARSRLPAWALSSLPEEPTELKAAAAGWLREHAGQLRSIGQDVWRALIHILFGMVIGGMIAVSREAGDIVLFAQVRISALNTALNCTPNAARAPQHPTKLLFVPVS
jgi:hypothetical protein